ncbi:hypothetical protein Q6303_29680, partial [Klebsiella variicola]|nr:hypothetical protein [Klebsiella variicola]
MVESQRTLTKPQLYEGLIDRLGRALDAARTSDSSAGRVLHAFGQYSAASEAASPFTKWYGAGVVLYKPFEGR